MLCSYCVAVPIIGSNRITVKAPERADIQNINPGGVGLHDYCCNTSDFECMSFKGDRDITDSTSIRRPCWYTHRDITSAVIGSMVTIGTCIKVRVAIGAVCSFYDGAYVHFLRQDSLGLKHVIAAIQPQHRVSNVFKTGVKGVHV